MGPGRLRPAGAEGGQYPHSFRFANVSPIQRQEKSGESASCRLHVTPGPDLTRNLAYYAPEMLPENHSQGPLGGPGRRVPCLPRSGSMPVSKA